MFGFTGKMSTSNMRGQIDAIHRAQAVIEFTLDGTILHANDNFLKAMGYALAEVQGRHHRMFVEPAEAQSDEYRSFWDRLRHGEFSAGQYKRIGKGGKDVWIQASYNPILDRRGRPVKVVKFATDITAQKMQMADFEGQIAAIDKAQAVIQFRLDGTILDANENFLKAMGYTLAEVQGRHHRMFVDASYARSAEYAAFWDKLGQGEYDAGQYRRIGKGGKDIWIQASYNPIKDASGRPYKVVKYATDITQQVTATQMMQQAVRQTQDVVAAARADDLTRRIPLDGKTGDIRSLCEGVNDLLDGMSGIITNIKAASETIAAAAGEISAGSQDLAQRTESQAASIEETAASMHEVTATVKQNADNAQAANQLATAARGTAESGGRIVQEAVAAVSQIEESATRIADIVGLIDEIAFQTNLLALNASVEAARAGEAGKGFAVVAQEVRALAQRSANASKDIKALIATSNAQVKTGAELVGRTGQSLADIVGGVKKVAEIVAEIAAASREQSSGLEQINTAVASMDEMTQRNGALVEETSASAQSLAGQAGELATLVQRYRIAGAAAPASRIVPLRQPAVAKIPATAKPVANDAVQVPRAASDAAGDGDWEEF